MDHSKHIVIIGGGAAGFFAAVTAKAADPSFRVTILEKTAKLLSKVRISGGGRCNVTHHCFDPKELVKNYPRGHKELIGPFHRFQPKDTIEWFTSRGVEIKVEEDGRMFPISDSSEDIINCLMKEANLLGVEIRLQSRVDSITPIENGFLLKGENEEHFANKLLLATGSHPTGHEWARSLGHTIVEPVPSLFTFNIPDFPLQDLSGITIAEVTLNISDSKLTQKGPLLITHWGFSGPAALKLSAWGARHLHEKEYKVELKVNWTGSRTYDEVYALLSRFKKDLPSQQITKQVSLDIPKNLWRRLIERADISPEHRFMEIQDKALKRFSELLIGDRYQVEGKTTHKAEFVTCGGITLSEVNFKTMESRVCPSLYFAGEILDIDGVTGGFNFQNAWTTGFIAGNSIAGV